MRRLTLALAALSMTLMLALPLLASPQNSEFTYQGFLQESSGPADGSYDFTFTLWDAATAGNQVGPTVTLTLISVVDGVFTVDLNFGMAAFMGDERWLEISAGVTSTPPVMMTPRQKINATPYALYALNGGGGGGSSHWQLNGSDLSNNTSGNVGIGVTNPTRKLGVAGGGEFDDHVHVTKGLTVHETPGANSARAVLANLSFLGAPYGGALHTYDEAGTQTGWFGSAINEGGFISLLSADGSQGLVATGGTSHADLGLWNNGADRTAYLSGDQGDLGAHLALHAGRTQTVDLDGSRNLAGYLGLRRYDGAETVQIHADQEDGSAKLVLRDGVATRVELNANSSGGGQAVFRNASAIGTLVLSADSNSSSGQIEVKQQFGVVGVGIYGDWGDGKGRIITDVLQITGGADLSESFDIDPIDEPRIEPGMVVSIDPNQAGKLAVSNQAYDRRVAGIVSGADGIAPGMLMGQNGTLADGEHPVALTGRVYCMATAANGAIEPGDMLTTSDIAGHAMRVDDPSRAYGAVLGKAMTGLKDGSGMVLVLVGLQ